MQYEQARFAAPPAALPFRLSPAVFPYKVYRWFGIGFTCRRLTLNFELAHMEAVKTRFSGKASSAAAKAVAPAPPAPTRASIWLAIAAGCRGDHAQNPGAGKGGSALAGLVERLQAGGIDVPSIVSTPYVNTIPVQQQPPYPGNREIERRIKSLARWNAMAMVVNANHGDAGVGGHISSYASMATLYEVAYNHFFHGGVVRRRTPITNNPA